MEVDYEPDHSQYSGYEDEGFRGFAFNKGVSDPDYFITFVFSLDDINAALAKAGAKDQNGNILNMTPETSFRYVIGTATQDNSLNGDINGMEGIKSQPPLH